MAAGAEGTHVQQVVVVGAGIVGASVAFHVARTGRAVTVLERARPAAGATGKSFAWIGNDGDGSDGPAAALNDAAPGEWHRLEAELTDVRVRWSGSLSWTDDGSQPRTFGRSLERARVLHRSEVAALEPNLRTLPEQAIHFPGDGAVDPVAVTRALVRAARAHGARVIRTTAIALRRHDGRVTGVETAAGFLPSGDVVLAAGLDVPALVSPLGVELPVSASPAVLARFRASENLVRTLIATSGMEVRSGEGSALLAALACEGGATAEDLEASGRRALAWLTSAFHGGDEVALTSVDVGVRPIPVDGLPVVGRWPTVAGAYVVVMHPGVQLAPVVGRLVAEEVVHGTDAVELADCRPARFTTGDRGRLPVRASGAGEAQVGEGGGDGVVVQQVEDQEPVQQHSAAGQPEVGKP